MTDRLTIAAQILTTWMAQGKAYSADELLDMPKRAVSWADALLAAEKPAEKPPAPVEAAAAIQKAVALCDAEIGRANEAIASFADGTVGSLGHQARRKTAIALRDSIASLLSKVAPAAPAPATPALSVSDDAEPLAEVRLACGRQYLSVAGVAVAMEGDPMRDADLPEEAYEPIPADELDRATIGGKPVKGMDPRVIRSFRRDVWSPRTLDFVAKRINAAAVEVAPAAIVPVRFNEFGVARGDGWTADYDHSDASRTVRVYIDLRPGEDAGVLVATLLAAGGRAA